MQPDSSLSQEQSTPTPKKKPGKFNLQIVLLIVFLLASAGLGYWAFQTNGALKTAQQRFADLQAKHDALDAEKNTLSGELGQINAELETVKSELETTKATLATTKSDISKANNEVTALKKKMEKSSVYLLIMEEVFTEDNLLVTAIMVSVTNDSQLKELFDKYVDSRSSVDFFTWMGYMLATAQDILTQ